MGRILVYGRLSGLAGGVIGYDIEGVASVLLHDLLNRAEASHWVRLSRHDRLHILP